MKWKEAKEKGRQEDGWDAFNKTHGLLKMFDQRHHLPKTWNLNSAWAEQMIGCPNPVINTDSDSVDGSHGYKSDDMIHQHSEGENSGSESQDKENNNHRTGLDALEARTQKE